MAQAVAAQLNLADYEPGLKAFFEGLFKGKNLLEDSTAEGGIIFPDEILPFAVGIEMSFSKIARVYKHDFGTFLADLIAEINRAIKYGLDPHEEVEGWLEGLLK